MKPRAFFLLGFALCVTACAVKKPGSAPVPVPTIERAADTKIQKDGGTLDAQSDTHAAETR
ncbi:MAG TPA: hypothetical protein VGM44_04470 [Polyangiaceae bacterium]|jgi:hypothetical protein